MNNHCERSCRALRHQRVSHGATPEGPRAQKWREISRDGRVEFLATRKVPVDLRIESAYCHDAMPCDRRRSRGNSDAKVPTHLATARHVRRSCPHGVLSWQPIRLCLAQRTTSGGWRPGVLPRTTLLCSENWFNFLMLCVVSLGTRPGPH